MIRIVTHLAEPLVLLNHPVRRRIYEHLEMLPGDYFRNIARSLGLAPGTVRHHLLALKDHELLEVRKEAGRCRFYPTAEPAQRERNSLYVQHWKYRDLRRRILLDVGLLPDPRPSLIAKNLQISRQLVAYHLRRLEELGLVRRADGRYVRT